LCFPLFYQLESDILNRKKLIGNSSLLLAAIIWGSAFVAQRVGMDYVGPLTFGAVRFWMAAAFLVPVAYFSSKMTKKRQDSFEQMEKRPRGPLLIAGLICGIILFMGSTLQQFGLVFTTAGKAGFITALYIILVPVFGLVIKQNPGYKSWAGVFIGTSGLYLLTVTESLTIAAGDFIVLIGAGFWALHVLFIDHFNPFVDGIKLSLTQFIVCAILSTIGMFLFEEPTLSSIESGIIPILYAGVLSGGVGFTLQILGQRYTSPTVASLLLSMEAVFGALFGYLILDEIMSNRELIGCALMFAAIIISQFPSLPKREVQANDL
jgi:drug/metabolite transporter (DMT)-like permease